MGVFAPEIKIGEPEGVTSAPSVSTEYSPEQLTNLGKSVADALSDLQWVAPKEGLVSDQEQEEEYTIPEFTPASSKSGLPVEAQAFLDAIASAEGTGGDYNIIVGGKKFEGYEQHPNIVGLKTKAGPSTAAGKYQITKQTWDDFSKRYPDLKDFSPENQDKAAMYIATERYKKSTKGRDLAADLAAGNTTYLREALKDTWTSLRLKNDFEKRLYEGTQERSPTTIKPVGFTNIKYTNQQAVRNKEVTPELELKLDVAVSTVLGTGYTVEIFSGGQVKKDSGGPKRGLVEYSRRTGTIRHDEDDLGRGLAADVRIFDPAGKQITDRVKLDRVKDFWIEKGYGSVGTYMPGSGIHFDVWTKDKLLPGMSLTWSY